MNATRCPHCANRLIQKSAGGVKLRIQGAVTIDERGARGSCFWCKTEVALPLELAKSFELPEERFVIVERVKLNDS